MDQPIRIIGSFLSPYVRKVLVALELKGLQYEVDSITPFYGNDEFTRLSPLRRIPVLILTSSQAERDIALSYELHANAHLCKPADIGGYIALARMIESFWLKTVLRCSPSLV